MTEANNSEISVDELMHEIGEKADKRHDRSRTDISDFRSMISTATTVASSIENFLKNAEYRATVRTKWPDKFNRFPFNLTQGLQKIAFKVLEFLFRDQREVNFNLIQSLRESIVLNRQLMMQLTILQFQTDERLGVVNSYMRGLDRRLGVVDGRFRELDEHLGVVDGRFRELDEHLGVVDGRFRELDERLGIVDNHTRGLDERLGIVDSYTRGLDKHVQQFDERHLRNDNFLKNDLTQQKRLIASFLEEARRRLPEPFDREQLGIFVNEDRHLLDAFYAAFEDRFRGSREDILNRLKVYLPFIEEAKVGTPECPILDVGCGRGEWLEFLELSGYIARGIDINKVMLEQCLARGLEVFEADVIDYLRGLPDGSLGAVTGFHIIEHLPFEVLVKLIDETVRVLRPNGLAIFETPNPQNVLVGSNTFYLDPTHRNPLPSTMIEFVAEARGLHQVKTIYLQPFPENFRISGSELAERFSEYFYGPQDYAIIGYKA